MSNETNEWDRDEKKVIITSQLGAQFDLTGMCGHADVVTEPEGYDARALITLTLSGSNCFGQVIPLGSYKDQSLAAKIASELRCSLENETSYTLPSEREENIFGQLSLCFQGSSMIITKQDGNKVDLKEYNGIVVIHDCALFPESEKESRHKLMCNQWPTPNTSCRKPTFVFGRGLTALRSPFETTSPDQKMAMLFQI